MLDGQEYRQRIALAARVDEPDRAWYVARLRGRTWPRQRPSRGTLDIVDLFSGAGGLSSGVSEAVACLGWRARTVLAIDQDESASSVHAYNVGPVQSLSTSVRDVLNIHPLQGSGNGENASPKSLKMPSWPDSVSTSDIVVGGPPCQGHSTFNNISRGSDPRNSLYLWMPAAAYATNAKILIVENVASVKADSGGAVDLAMEWLDSLGYAICFDSTLSADAFGVAQTRSRHFLIAIRRDVLDEEGAREAASWLTHLETTRLSVLDAIEDLIDPSLDSEYNTPSVLSEENRSRIDWLFDNGKYELDDRERPASHRDGHTYPSVYGRMRGNHPSQTITTGFLSPGRGRYVHPERRRTMTPHEGARIQGFPDTYRFILESGREPGRTHMATMIGDAVPPPLAFHVGLAALQMVRWTSGDVYSRPTVSGGHS